MGAGSMHTYSILCCLLEQGMQLFVQPSWQLETLQLVRSSGSLTPMSYCHSVHSLMIQPLHYTAVLPTSNSATLARRTSRIRIPLQGVPIGHVLS